MKRILTVALPLTVVALAAGVAFAQMGGGMTGGMGGMMGGTGHMMGGDGQQGAGADCHGGAAGAQAIDETQAADIARQYANEHHLTFVKIEPLSGMHMTMWTAELTDDNGTVRTLHIGPSGHVMDHAAPPRTRS